MRCSIISATPGLHRAGGVLHPLAAVEAARLGAAHQGEPRVPHPLHPGHRLHHRGAHDRHARRDRYEVTRAVNETSTKEVPQCMRLLRAL